MGGAAAVVAVVVGAYSAHEQQQEQKKAREMQQKANEENRKVRAEQDAQNAAQRAAERRQQLREERVKRARVIQASANTGVANSSGEMGATGNLATQTGVQLGMNSGMAMHGAAMSAYSQNAADALTQANNHMVEANQWGQIGSLAFSFGANAGSIFGPNSAATPKNISPGNQSIQNSPAETFTIK